MEIWLKQDIQRIRIPVLPSEYNVKSVQINTAVNINALGEINLKGKRGLIQISFSSFFPKKYDSYCEYRAIDKPNEYVKAIETMKRNGNVKLIITGTPINHYTTIESFEWGENDGTGDVNYTLELKEYRILNIPVSTLQTEQPSEPSNENARNEPEKAETITYTVKTGDSLSTIAMKTTGSASWKVIYEQNKSVIGSNPNKIYPGQVLTILGAKKT